MLRLLKYIEFLRAEKAYLQEPEYVESPTCERCGRHPYNDFLYEEKHDGWCCKTCLEKLGYSEEEIEKMPRRDIYLDDWEVD